MKTGEIYTHALTNPKARFMSSENGPFPEFEAHFNEVGKLVTGEGRDESLVYAPYDMEWELVPQEVTWHEAINLWLDGNSVVCEYKGNRHGFDAGGIIMAMHVDKEKLKYGKWYIL